MKLSRARSSAPSVLLDRLVESPALVEALRELPAPTYAALVRRVGVEDAGELVALATTEQLVAAFDEDLFVNARPGERETFDSRRFAVWLEVLLEAGDQAAARRVAELSETFVVQALSSLVFVLDHDELMLRIGEGDQAAYAADKALESTLWEQIDGYLLTAKLHEGWDAVLALVLALDRDHRDLLVRLLDRCASLNAGYIEDLDALVSALSAEGTLAEDAEAEREARRSAQGYVEPRAARAFLAAARQGPQGERDALTRAYFRELGAPRLRPKTPSSGAGPLRRLLDAAGVTLPAAGSAFEPADETASAASRFSDALRQLDEADPARYAARLSELSYLANVLLAGAEHDGRRFRQAEAAEAALATVGLGAHLEVDSSRPRRQREHGGASVAELGAVLRELGADRLFQRASHALASVDDAHGAPAFLLHHEELAAALARCRAQTARRSKGKPIRR